MALSLTKEQQKFLRETLMNRAPEFLNLLDSPEDVRLSANQRDELRQIVTDEFCATGLRENDEPNARGLVLEDIIDRLGHL
jgi:hypothetical protein